jgi:nucleotide-binding universal stress UspA family protein
VKTVLGSAKHSSRKATEILGGSITPGDLEIRNILVPIDFSERSLEGVEAALSLIKHFGAELHLVHVFEPDYPLSSMVAIPLIVPELEVGQRVRRKLRGLAKHYSVPLRRENIHATKGRPFEEICRLGQEVDIDLIVIATRGNTGLKHLALGSTAERVVRHSPCPVLVVRKSEREKTLGCGFHKIVVPIDFSDCSMKGLAFGRRLACELGAKLLLLNSVALRYYVASDEYARYDLPKLLQQTEKSARGQMRDFVAKTNWGGVEVNSTIEIGHAGEQICAAAAQKADLIVIATHGHTGFKHIFLGSTAEYVVRHAPCPVLVVPSHPRVVPGSPSSK